MALFRRDIDGYWNCGKYHKEMREFNVFLCLVCANFASQLLFGEQWMVAVERSYFEGIALLTYWLCRKIDGE
jgi:hypothetical protein